MMLEPVQGEGGVNIPAPDYFKQVRQWCDRNGLLLILDEVQTGMGRLGTLFGYESFDVEPDVMTLAKALGGGVPIGAFLAKDSASVFEPKGEHGSTFGGNALTSAAAYASTKYIIDNNIPARARKMGDLLETGLKELKARHGLIKCVRGMGLLWAVQFDSDIAGSVHSACNGEGLLLGLLGNNGIRLMPPLTINEAELDTALSRLDNGISIAIRESSA